MIARSSAIALALAAATARAQPITKPDALPPLAQIRDDKQLAEALTAIAQDPAIHVDDPAARPLAQALMTEGVRQLHARAYDQALANFLEAYNKLPHPKILLDVASTLRDMGRLADAANTYQRYLTDPATAAERMSEVKELLHKLDEQLTILTVRVTAHGSEVSIDAGPFVPVGSALQTRMRPGIHLVRVRKDNASTEITVNGFEGETKEVQAALKLEVDPEHAPVGPPTPPVHRPTPLDPTPAHATDAGGAARLGDKLPIERTVPDRVDGWLITGTQYGADDTGTRTRHVRTGFSGPELAPIVPKYDVTDTGEAIVHDPHESSIASGAIGIMRIDAKGRCCAAGLGLAIARDRAEVEVAVLRSNEWGAYLGLRYRLFTGALRPYAGAGLPLFLFSTMDAAGATSQHVAVGLRGAAGVELYINGHLSVLGDLGIEHFWNVDGTNFEPTVVVPTVGVIGRM